MKKAIVISTICAMLFVLCLVFTSCGECEHIYDDCADTECNECAEKRDSMHSWKAADCVTPKTCEVCKKTEGKALGHDWITPDVDLCEVQSTCLRCGATDGENKEHTSVDDGDCTTEEKCTACQKTLVKAKSHDLTYMFSTVSDNTHVGDGKCNDCETVLEDLITIIFENDGVVLTELTGKYDHVVFCINLSNGSYIYKADAGEHKGTYISSRLYTDESCTDFNGSVFGTGSFEQKFYMGTRDSYIGIAIAPETLEPVTVKISMVEAD